ncbi:MAG: DUF1700 domain-containing protein [Schleiferilactobacillus perolens]|uniref:DUF1700 domain-containing protein n=1 Tax=Schleiferilactobacillus perolens TaxID=100468 RepID=UPI0039E92AFA
MTIDQYFIALEQALSPMQPDDRASALDYYREYVEDAGLTDSTLVIQRLGTPKQLAAHLLADKSIEEAAEPVTAPKRRYQKNAHMVWLIVLAVLSAPLSLPLVIIVAVLLLSGLLILASTAFTAIVAVGALILAGAGVGLAGLYIGISLLWANYFMALTYIGFGLAGFGLALLLFPFCRQLTRASAHVIGGFATFIYHKITFQHKPVEGGGAA